MQDSNIYLLRRQAWLPNVTNPWVQYGNGSYDWLYASTIHTSNNRSAQQILKDPNLQPRINRWKLGDQTLISNLAIKATSYVYIMGASHFQSAWNRDPNLHLMISRITRPGKSSIRVTEEEMQVGWAEENCPHKINVGQAFGGSCLDRDLIYNSQMP